MTPRREYPDQPMVGVGGVVIDDGRTLLIRRGGPPLKGEWSIPGGLLEVGETLEQGVARELAEETGLEVQRRRTHRSLRANFSRSSKRGRHAGRRRPPAVSFRHSRLSLRNPRRNAFRGKRRPGICLGARRGIGKIRFDRGGHARPEKSVRPGAGARDFSASGLVAKSSQARKIWNLRKKV